MKALSALRLLAGASLFSLVGVTQSSAQLFYHVYDVTSPQVGSGNNLGVAMNITFNFAINSGVGTLTVKIDNLSGTAKAPWGDGLGNYTTGILTGFGFDAPGGGLNFLSFTDDPNVAINFLSVNPYTETNPVGNFDYGAAADNPAPGNGVLAGQSATFEFKFGGDLTNFSETKFFKNNGDDADFGFRVQAVGQNGGSDKFVYYVNDNPPIPEPSTYGIAAAALLIGVAAVRRYRGVKITHA